MLKAPAYVPVFNPSILYKLRRFCGRTSGKVMIPLGDKVCWRTESVLAVPNRGLSRRAPAKVRPPAKRKVQRTRARPTRGVPTKSKISAEPFLATAYPPKGPGLRAPFRNAERPPYATAIVVLLFYLRI